MAKSQEQLKQEQLIDELFKGYTGPESFWLYQARSKGAFPSDTSILKIFYLALAKTEIEIEKTPAVIEPAGALCLSIVLTLRLLPSRALFFRAMWNEL